MLSILLATTQPATVEWTTSPYLIITLLFGGIIALYFIYYSVSANVDSKPQQEEKETKKEETKKVPKEKKKPEPKEKPAEEVMDPLQFHTLKGHTKEINFAVFSPDGKFVVSTADDRTLRFVWTETLSEKTPKFSKFNVPDAISAGAFSPDGKFLVLAMSYSRELLVYSVTFAEGKVVVKEANKFPTPHKDTIKSLCISPNGKLILTCGDNTILYLFNNNGTQLTSFNTSQMRNNMAAMSPDGKLFAVATWTADVKVLYLQASKSTGEFEKLTKVMDLGEHRTSVYNLCFSADSTRIATTSKDGTLKLWDVGVRYEMGADAKCLLTIQCPIEKKTFNLVALSPNGKVLATTVENHLLFYSMDGTLLHQVQNAHKTPIVTLSYAPNGSMLATTASSDLGIKLWKEPIRK